MERAGEKLKRVRERLKLTYRDVERASQQIASSRSSDEFAIALSRLADIENKGTVPTIFRLYSLCAIYRLDAQEVLRCYGVPLEMLPSESLNISLDETHLAHFAGEGPVTAPNPPDYAIDLNSTTFLNHVIGGGKSRSSPAERRRHAAAPFWVYRNGRRSMHPCYIPDRWS